MKTEHTPGPWKITKVTLGKIVEIRIDQEGGALAAGICHLPSLCNAAGLEKKIAPEIAGNAQLIAAAPDLLAALDHRGHGRAVEGQGIGCR